MGFVAYLIGFLFSVVLTTTATALVMWWLVYGCYVWLSGKELDEG